MYAEIWLDDSDVIPWVDSILLTDADVVSMEAAVAINMAGETVKVRP